MRGSFTSPRESAGPATRTADLQLSLFELDPPPGHGVSPVPIAPAGSDAERASFAPDAERTSFAPPIEGPSWLPRRIPAAGVDLVTRVLGRDVSCRIRRSRRARRLRLVVDRSAVLTIVLPLRCPLREVPEALEENARWIVRTVDRYRRRPRPTRARVHDGGEIRLLGVPHRVRIRWLEDVGERPRVSRDGAELVLYVPPLTLVPPAELLRDWLKAAARGEILARVHLLAEALGFRVGRVSVRDQRSKWGGCSHRGDLTFNWRLVLAPQAVLDYVIVHELCHLRELNHSARFWALLRELRPEFEIQRGWLEEHGEGLDLE